MTDALVWIVHGMLIGQLGFIILWFRMPWFHSWIGRALMLKSFALLLLIATSVLHYWGYALGIETYPGQHTVTLLVSLLVMVGIWYQFIALAREIWISRRGHRDTPNRELP